MKRNQAEDDAIFAVVPVNVLKASKARLAPHLDVSSRSRLSAAMLIDVLRVLRKVRRLERVTVVSADLSVRRTARAMGVHFLWEGRRRALNKAVRLGIRDAIIRNASATLIVPSDIPLITPAEVSRLLHLSRGYPVSLIPSKNGGGTNALLLRPPGILQPAFGTNSYRRHRSIARRKHLSTKVVQSKSLSFDVDEPSDLARIQRLLPRNETRRFLRSIDKPRPCS